MEQKWTFRLATRRDFLRRTAGAVVGTGVLAGTIKNLRFVNAALAQSSPSDYKAMVCLFLAGGNDANNLVIPTLPSEYDQYAAARTPVLAIPLRDAAYSVLPISPLNSDGHAYGFHPACPELVTLFGEGKLAVLFNTGTLVYPLTRAQYLAGNVPKPPRLFSHADQVTQWQTSLPDRPPLTGWGGRCADLLASGQPDGPISLCITLAGNNTFEAGDIVSPYSVSSSGAIALSSVTGTRLQTLKEVLGLPYSNLQARTYADVALHAIDTASLLNGAIAATAASGYWMTPFPGTVTLPTDPATTFSSSLGPQLKMIARLIEAGGRSVAAGGFGMTRQIFFCQVGGYDLHTNQTGGPGSTIVGAHANLLADLSQSLLSFQRAMEQLGLANKVTVFTASDFGRTFVSNGQGSDHGWGSHHLILGGAVKGQRTYGQFPTLVVNGPDDTNTGRWIPTTAIDQYFATIAAWFGLDGGSLATVFPNLSRFSTPNLGFL